jgi:hypothetical protein
MVEAKELKKDIEQATKRQTEDKQAKGLELSNLRQCLRNTIEKQHMKRRKATSQKYRACKETMTKEFAGRGKKAKTKDPIYALRRSTNTPGEGAFERDSEKMAEIARNYHNGLQLADNKDGPGNKQERETAIRAAEERINQILDDEQREDMGEELTESELKKALWKSKSDSSPGLDGWTYSFMKEIERQAASPKKNRKFLATALLIRVIRNIEEVGVRPGTDFNKGWMCPLYKKNKKDRIENYRPITLMNCDYKLYTKMMANRLVKEITTIIDKAQAGFIPGRQISALTQLTRMVMAYAEALEEDGMIVALDQEKAYNKIKHDYLWRVLKRFGLPENMIKSIRHLYTNAETVVCVNGYMSSPFTVSRGVRQGDPLSCLLFDIAIEPLSLALRESDLEGYKVPGREEERLIATLFADDTTVYLSKKDSFNELEKILGEWCKASGAKFNSGKTEVIPIGSEAYRTRVIESRQMSPDGEAIPACVTIREDGEAIRMLGAWFGNEIEDATPWNAVISKIESALERWSNTQVTTMGQRHVLESTIGGYTQYLAQVQGMPRNVSKTLEKMTRKYLWNETSSKVNKETTYAPIERGGLRILDIDAKKEAIDLMWVKQYLDLSED